MLVSDALTEVWAIVEDTPEEKFADGDKFLTLWAIMVAQERANEEVVP
jgi:hypothetical protein